MKWYWILWLVITLIAILCFANEYRVWLIPKSVMLEEILTGETNE